MTFDLRGKVALVTGGNGGIGLGIARGLAAHGANMVVAARSATKSAAAVAELTGIGVKACALSFDVTNEASVESMTRQAEEHFGRLDILVNNAGINIRKPVHELALSEWTSVVDTNLTGAFLCCRAAHPAMKRAGGGKIINIGSMMSIFGASFAPAYGASKGGIVQLTKSLAVAWAADNIQVNAILPGWIDTDLTKQTRSEISGLEQSVIERTPAGRWGIPDDLSGTGVFLASPASDFVTGSAIPVDGGYSIKG